MLESIDENQGLMEIKNLAVLCDLAEGEEGVKNVLRHIFRFQPVPIHQLARDVQIPVPVVASLRRELEKRKFTERRAGIILTARGLALLDSLGISGRIPGRAFEVKYTRNDYLDKLVPEIENLVSERPDPDVTLDQSHATVETIIRRAAYIYERNALESKDILFLGDDDLTSLSVLKFADEFGIKLGLITVMDVDQRILDYIHETSEKMGWVVETVCHDLKEPLPGLYNDRFDVFVSDPPYTLPGISLFALRGVQALKPVLGKKGVLCFSKREPVDSRLLYANLNIMGLVPQELLPSFNRYVGAQLHAGSSSLLLCALEGSLDFNPDFDVDKIYTASKKQRKD
tara:strand:- start:318 stop:1346 length:1029 start_codon:yes stop_codon:yes gene_type:complete